MSYNRENYIRIKREFEEKRRKAQDEADRRREDLHEKHRELAQIDRALSETGSRIFAETMRGKDGLERRMEAVRLETQELSSARDEWMTSHGFDSGYTDPDYQCKICSDTGAIGFEMCVCFRRELVKAGYESSGIGKLIKTQRFESFDLSYYADDPTAMESMRKNLGVCKNYAATFSASQRANLLLRGNTGLGKTHLSTAMAKVIIERGYDVVYETAQNIFSDFETERFTRSYDNYDADEKPSRRYFDCDLLIIDDLGTELSNQFTISCLYNIINTRINYDRSIIINTNLPWDELRRRYSDRITSRLLGECMPLLFTGKDVRAEKLKTGK